MLTLTSYCACAGHHRAAGLVASQYYLAPVRGHCVRCNQLLQREKERWINSHSTCDFHLLHQNRWVIASKHAYARNLLNSVINFDPKKFFLLHCYCCNFIDIKSRYVLLSTMILLSMFMCIILVIVPP